MSDDEIMLNRLWIQRDDLLKENKRLEERIKRLEEAGDELSYRLRLRDESDSDAYLEWLKAKEDKL